MQQFLKHQLLMFLSFLIHLYHYLFFHMTEVDKALFIVIHTAAVEKNQPCPMYIQECKYICFFVRPCYDLWNDFPLIHTLKISNHIFIKTAKFTGTYLKVLIVHITSHSFSCMDSFSLINCHQITRNKETDKVYYFLLMI